MALRLAAQVIPDYPDGVWLVDLTPLADPALVARAVAKAVGVRERSGQPLLDALTHALRTKRLLLVLDNCEHMISPCAHLVDSVLKACPGVRVLATSREPLRISGEFTWWVPSLSLPQGDSDPGADHVAECDSVRLFVVRAAASAMSSTYALLDATCSHSDLPAPGRNSFGPRARSSTDTSAVGKSDRRAAG
jgi:predicted ATPase